MSTEDRIEALEVKIEVDNKSSLENLKGNLINLIVVINYMKK